MRVLFISGELIAGDLAYRLKLEGCEVKLFIEHQDQKHCLDGFVEKTDDWRKELTWVGKDGLIVFDDVGYGKIQDDLRKEGYRVVGGSEGGDKLELDRSYGQEILRSCGVFNGDDFNTRMFTIDEAIEFVKKNKASWVIKQDDHNNALNYVGVMEDGSDVINILENYKINFGGSHSITLQKKVHGVEIAIGRFFNGKDWVGPSIINIEHKHLCNDDIGPLGGETGTLMWFEENENNKLFQRSLAKLKSQLEKINYRGYFDINCIVYGNDEIYPLEITSRFGSSTIQTQQEIANSPWSEFLLAVAKGENFSLKYKKNGYGITVALTVAPFPYRTSDKSISQNGTMIFFKKELDEENFKHIYFEGVLNKKINGKSFYYVSGDLGYVLYITGFGGVIQEAREGVYDIINKIIIPKMFYRTDIGLRFIKKDQELLKNWGWI